MPIELLPPPVEAKPKSNLFARRAAAYLSDLALLYATTVLTCFVCVLAYAALAHPGDAAALRELAASSRASAFTKAAHILYYFSYFTISHWYAGRTFGKWAFGLRVRKQGASDLSFLRALARSLLYVVSGQLALGIGFLLPLFRRDGLTLHDLLAGTEVVDAAGAKPAEEPAREAA